MYLQLLLREVLPLAAPTLVALGLLTHFARKHDLLRQTSVRGLAREQFTRWSSLARRCSVAARVISVTVFAVLVARVFVNLIQLVLSRSLGTSFMPEWGWGYFVVPVAAATLGVLAHTLLSVTRGTTTAGEPTTVVLEPRTAGSFTPTAWIVTWIISATVLVITVVTAGLIADVDEEGRHAVLSIGIDELGASTDFLGWYYGVPILIGVAVLSVVTVVALGLGARAPLPAHAASGRTVDIVLRTLSARTALSLGSGALMVTTGLAWTFIAGALKLRMSGALGSIGTVYFDSDLAGLSSVLQVAAWLITGLGLAITLLPAVTRWPRVWEETTPTDSVASGPSLNDPSVLYRTMG